MAFDPYRSWLGISVSRRPLDFYELLGVDATEHDIHLIDRTALRRLAAIRPHQFGSNRQIADLVFAEVARARLILMDADRRAEYDASRLMDWGGSDEASRESSSGERARQFDPYEAWLDVPPDLRPPDHYAVLGIERSEDDTDAIDKAALRRMARIRPHQLGPRADVADAVFARIALARLILIDPDRRSEYIAEHRQARRARSADDPAGTLPLFVAVAVNGTHADAPEDTLSEPLGVAEIRTGSVAGPTAAKAHAARPPAVSALFVAAAVFGVCVLIYQAMTASPARRAQNDKTAVVESAKTTPPRAVAELSTMPPAGPRIDLVAETKNLKADDLIAEAFPGSGSMLDMPKTSAEEKRVVASSTTPAQTAPAPTSTAKAPAKTRLPVPQRAEQDKTRILIQELFAADYSRTGQYGRRVLVDKLLEKAEDARDRPVDRYVLLTEAADVSIRAGDPETAFRAFDELGITHSVDPLDLKSALLASVGSTIDAEDLGDAAFSLVDRAVADRRYDAAAAVLTTVTKGVTKKPRGAELKRRAQDLAKEVRKLKEATTALESAPDDAKLHLSLGKTLCLIFGDWEDGVAHLAKGNDPQLKDAAARERAGAAGPEAVGDFWWELAEQNRADYEPFRKRAYFWYQKAAGVPGDLTHAVMQKRVAQLGKRYPELVAAPASGTLRILEGHLLEVNGAVFTPGGRRVLSVSEDQTARIWEVATGRELGRIDAGGGPLHAVAIFPDGRRALVGCGDSTARIVDLEAGEVLSVISGFSQAVSCVALSADGRVAAAGTADGNLRIWDLNQGNEVVILAHKGGTASASFSANARLLATGGADKTVRVWDVATGRQKGRFLEPEANVASVTFFPDSRHLASAGGETKARLGDLESGEEIRQLEAEGVVNCVAISSDGRRLLSGHSGRLVVLWDPKSGRSLDRFVPEIDDVRVVAFSPDGRRALAAGKKLIWLGNLPR